MKIKLLLFILQFVLVFQLYSQEYYYRNYTIDDGLPTSEIYHVFQDSKGFIWFSTDKGVSRYNGYEFKNFDTSDGLLDNTIFEVYEDYKNRLWFVSFSNKLCYLENDSIYAYKYNDVILNAIIEGGVYYMKNGFYVDKNDKIFLSYSNCGLISIDSAGVIDESRFSLLNDDVSIIDFGFEKSFIGKNKGVKNYNSIFYRNIKEKMSPVGKLPTPFRAHLKDLYKCSFSDKFLFSEENNFFVYENSKYTSYELPYKILVIAELSEDLIFIGTKLNGAIIFSLKEGREIVSLLEGKSVSYMIKDFENGYWVSTLNNGVFYFPTFNIKNEKFNGLNIELVKSIGDSLFIGQSGSEFILYEGNKYSFLNYSDKNIEVLNDIEKINGQYILGTSHRLVVSKDLKNFKVYSKLSEDIPNNKSVLNIKGNGLNTYIGTSNTFIHIKDGNFYKTFNYDTLQFRSNCLFLENDNTVEIGTLNGLLEYKNRTIRRKYETDSLLNNRIDEIVKFKSNKVYATKGAGLIIFSEGKYRIMNESDGLISNFVSCIKVDGNDMWIGTNNGIQKLSFDEFNNSIHSTLTIQKRNGLISNEVTDIELFNGNLFVGTKEGLSEINLKEYKINDKEPNLYFTNIKIDNKKIQIDSFITIKPSNKTIAIEYTALNYRSEGLINYRYLMQGVDTTWVYTNDRKLQYTLLPRGNYILNVQAQNEDGLWSEQISKLYIKVLPKLFQKWWFLSIWAFLISIGIYYIIKNRVKQIKRKNQEKLDILELKQYSLRQQMNPHFIFNTLNSIQLYVLEKDTFSSHKYLAMFAKLMRMTLDNSRHSNILLKDEIKSLQLYLDLETLRFEDKISYELIIEDEDILYNKIPTLMIQPFVENAIWHGLMHKSEKGKVTISIMEKKNRIYCIVEDDGVGRESRLERDIQNKPHKSLGTKILKERLELLNSVYQDKFSVNYIDLKDDYNNPIGTKVELIIPIIA